MKKIKIGIFGVGPRGCQLGKEFLKCGCDIVAACDFRPEREAAARTAFSSDLKYYQSFDDFIDHPIFPDPINKNLAEQPNPGCSAFD
jgi:predicted dehydrogenase